MIVHITRATRHFLLWSLVFVAVSLTTLRILLVSIEDYKQALAQNISVTIGSTVTIAQLGAKMRGINPELILKKIQISTNPNSKPLTINEIRVGVNLWHLLIDDDKLSSMWITLVGANLSIIHKIDNTFAIEGLTASDTQPTFLFQGKKYKLLQSSITFYDEKNPDKSVFIEQFNGAILNNGAKHRINLLAKFNHNPLQFLLDFEGTPFDLTTLSGTGFLESKNVQLAELPLSLENFSFLHGSSDFVLWFHYQKGQLTTANGEIKLHNVHAKTPSTHWKFNFLQSQFHAQQQNEQWQLTSDNLQIELNDFLTQGAIRVDGQANELATVGLFINQFDLHNLPQPLGLQSIFKNVRLFADIKNQRGAAQFSANNSTFNSDLFREPLAITTFNSTFLWQKMPDFWQISAPEMILNTPDIESNSRLVLKIGETNCKNVADCTFLDLQTAFKIDDARQTKRYFPTKIMDIELVNWLDNAFVQGQIPRGDLLFYGKLGDFPFKQNQGVFEIPFHVEHGELNFAPDWLPITDLKADVLFFQNSLQLDLQGKADNVTVDKTTIKILDFTNNDTVLIDGKFNGEINQVLNALQKTPQRAQVDALLNVIAPQGMTEISLSVKLPISEKTPTKVNGETRLHNAKLNLKPLNLNVVNINGAVKFDEKGIFSEKIDAIALNHAIEIKLKNASSQATIEVKGRVAIPDLKVHFDLPLDSTWINGDTDYHLTLTLPHTNEMPILTLQSELSGVNVNLPDDLGKTKFQSAPLQMNFELNNAAILPITLNYNEKLRAFFALNTTTQQIEDLEVVIGEGVLAKKISNQFNILIKQDTLALDEWLTTAAAGKESATHKIQIIQLYTPHAFWKKTALGVFDLMLKAENSMWHGVINSSFAKGDIRLPINFSGAEQIDLHLTTLDISALKKLESQQKNNVSVTPESFPSLYLESQKTFWQNVNLGQTRIETEHFANGIRFKTFQILGDNQKLTLTGDWQLNRTQLQGRLELPKAGSFLKQLDITKDIIDTKGDVKLALNWQGAPHEFSVEKLHGQIDLNLTNGRILSIEPGIGRILGVLALEQWLKRLQLDFSDVYQEGLTFNNITGHFELANAKATTNDLVVDAIPAKITLNGEIDFNQKTVNFLVKVTPKSADAVPIAGTIVNKIMNLVGRSLTGEEQEGFFFGTEYQITGSWKSIAVIPLHKHEGLWQKTWNGIADFPWFHHQ